MSGNAITLQIAPAVLEPLVEQVVRQVLVTVEQDRAALTRKLAYSEPEAAALLSMQGHQLRDERLRGRIKASVGPGRRILYTQADLLEYLAQHRWAKEL